MQDNNEAFIRLFSKHETTIRRYTLSLLPDWTVLDDILQETSVAMWRKFDQYDSNQSFANWACRFAYYEVLRYRKRQRKYRFFSDATLELLAQETPEPKSGLREERRQALGVCVESLPEDDRDLVGLRYATSKTIAELSSEIDVPAVSLYRQLERIRRSLLNCVNKRLSGSPAYSSVQNT